MPTFEGSSIQAAIENGLKQMKLQRGAVNVQVIATGKKGFLGFGRKPAVVKLDKLPEPAKKKPVATEQQAKSVAQRTTTKSAPVHRPVTAEIKRQKPTQLKATATEVLDRTQRRRSDNAAVLQQLKDYITDICASLKTPVTVKVTQKSGQVIYQLGTDKEGLVIGKHGRMINSLQYLAQTYFNQHGHGKQRIVLNVGNYRQRREETLQRLADKAAMEVIATGKPYLLDDMPSFERKIIHQQLASNAHVQTTSEGKDPHRYVIIAPNTSNKF
ncbi:RNA-binding cell elongation regulator Jag/EloR [Agrilactobacillus fermenti]|uniref:RNA-binding cell elongation regulator Jag/EloR n=1 Tax=Agrilactobacillus fermenti TaxID=2586909 RepID=UPI001E5A3E86|nr:RNA-binding cell elongation regulator Jag/EloR [Agrilactobacillus fermenti]MCD2257165.1 protein jag [Agrilactobacillus fermenti]